MEKLGSEKQSDLLKATQQSRAEAIHQVDSKMKGFISHPLVGVPSVELLV